jgi:hypothetical protein
MLVAMLAHRKTFKILNAIVGRVLVDVVDIIALWDWTSLVLPHMPMQEPATWRTPMKVSLMRSVVAVRISAIPMPAILDDLCL